MHGLHEAGAGLKRMRNLPSAPICALILLGTAALAQAQPGAAPKFDVAAVERGKNAFTVACGFCHGSNARGGEGGPDLIRSVLVLDDESGREIGAFLRVGRPGSGMPAFDLPSPQVDDIVTFLHSRIAAAAFRNTYQIGNILVGDATAGEVFFNGGGRCNTCHSPSGDLKGVGAKYEAVNLQLKFLMPRSGGRGSGERGGPVQGPPINVTVTLPAGEIFRGALVRITDFDVTLRDQSKVARSFARNGDVPKVELTDPLQHHLDMLTKYTDKNIHDLTAYLVTLK